MLSMAVPVNDLLSEPFRRAFYAQGVHSGRGIPPVPLQRRLVVHVGQCLRSPHGTGTLVHNYCLELRDSMELFISLVWRDDILSFS